MHHAIIAARRRIEPRWAKAARTAKIIAMADKIEPQMRNSFLRAVDEMKSNIDMKLLTQSIEQNDRVLSSVAMNDRYWGRMLESSAKIPVKAFGMAGEIGSQGLSNQFGIKSSFNMKNPRAQAWARASQEKLIVEIGDSTRQGIRQVIGSAFDLGIPSRDTAKVIKEMVGLTERQGTAVFRFRERLIGEGRKADQVARMTKKYETKLLKYRSNNIARTEIAKASNEGLIESWRQAVDQKLLDPKATNVEWLAAYDDRICPICAELGGTVYSYIDIESGLAFAPPAHPMCRCTLGITFGKVTGKQPANRVPSSGAPPIAAALPPSIPEIAASTADAVPVEVTVSKSAIKKQIEEKRRPWPIDDDVTRLRGDQYVKDVDKHYDAYIKDLTLTEKTAIREYTDLSYLSINNQLIANPRALKKPLAGQFDEWEIADARKINTSILKSPDPPPPDLVWRGMADRSWDDYKEGEVFQLNGFQSTSLEPSVAHIFAELGQGTVFEIRPAKGLYIKQISEVKSEYEFLLPHGAKYRVVARKEVKIVIDEGERSAIMRVIQVEMVE